MSNKQIEANDSKRPKLSHEEEQDMDQRPIAGPSNEHASPKLFTLNIDCFDEIFVYLSVIDVLSLGASCQVMQKVAGEFLKRNYPNISLHVGYDTRSPTYKLYTYGQFVTSIRIDGIDLERSAILSLYPNAFGSVHKMVLNTELNGNVADAINKYIHQLEVVDISCDVNVNLYDRLLKWCTNLKTLHISRQYLCPEQIPKQDSWMCQKYPKLEHFEFNSRDLKYELMTFLEKNSNLKTFGMRADDLWMYRNKIMNSQMRLNLFKIRGATINDSFFAFCELLNKLYEQEFYKRLHIEISAFKFLPSTVYAALSSVLGLERLDVQHKENVECLPKISHLKELTVRENRGVAFDSKLITKRFMNLEKLSVTNANDHTILTIVKGLPKLKMFTIDCYNFGGDKTVTLKLKILDAERLKLAGARKLTIVVPIDLSSRTKKTNFEMIEIKFH